MCLCICLLFFFHGMKPVQVAVEGLEVGGASCTPVRGQLDPLTGGTACPHVQEYTWHILDALHMPLLGVPDVFHLSLVQLNDKYLCTFDFLQGESFVAHNTLAFC